MKRLLLIGVGLIGFLILSISLVALFFNVATKPYIFSADAVPASQVVIIPGAGILRSGGLSPILAERTETALALYRADKAEKILVTGDDSGEAINEVEPVRRYLLEKDVPAEDIFLDHAGFDTYSSMYRARVVFVAASAIIVTQDFHLPRAVYLARALGVDAYGVAPVGENYLARNYLREALANVKALFNLAVRRQPKFLGETIPLSGDNPEAR